MRIRLFLAIGMACLPTATSGAEEFRNATAGRPRLTREAAVAAMNGIVVPMITPVTEDLTFDAEAMKALVDYLVAEGVHGLFPCSMTGKYELFSREEKRRIIRTVVEATAGRVPVFAGVDDATPELTLAQARWAEAAGVDGLMVIPPGQDERFRSREEWYAVRERLPAWQTEVLEFYRQLHHAVNVFIVVHDRGDRGLYVEPETYAKLLKLPRVIGLKKSSANVRLLPEIRQAVGDHLAISCGNEYVYLGALSMGCTGGVVGGGANIYPKLLLGLRDCFRAGDLDAAFSYQTRINEAARRLRDVKEARSFALQALGVPVKPFSRPEPDDEWSSRTTPPTKRDIEDLQHYVRRICNVKETPKR